MSSPAIRAAVSGSHCPVHRLLSNTEKMSLETLAGHRGSPGKETALLADNEWTLRIWGREDSLGVVFYEMLCGRSPYASRSSDKIVQELLLWDSYVQHLRIRYSLQHKNM